MTEKLLSDLISRENQAAHRKAEAEPTVTQDSAEQRVEKISKLHRNAEQYNQYKQFKFFTVDFDLSH